MTPINFTANYLKTVYLPQKVSKGIYKPCETSIVEFDTSDKNDIRAIAKAASDWENITPGFAYQIFNDAIKDRPFPDILQEHYLGLTTQNSDYEHINPDKLQGLALFSETANPKNELNWLQVNPNTNTKSSSSRTYKKVGTELVNYMKQITDKPILVQSADDAIKFYEKNDFRHIDSKHKSILVWG